MADPVDPPADSTPDPVDQLGEHGLKALEQERKGRKAAERRLQDADSRLEAMQRAEVERVAGQAQDGYKPLLSPADLWTTDIDLAAMLDEHGAVDASKVRKQVGKVLEDRPHWGSQPPKVAGTADAGKGVAAQPNMDELAAKIVRGR